MNYYFSPVAGIIKKKIGAGKFEYLGAAIADKEAKKKKCKYEVDAHEISDSEHESEKSVDSGEGDSEAEDDSLTGSEGNFNNF